MLWAPPQQGAPGLQRPGFLAIMVLLLGENMALASLESPATATPLSSPSAMHLHAPGDGMVGPAQAGQGGALHLDFHSLDGPRWAQVCQGHLHRQ